MTVNDFSHEDLVRAAYDAAERCLLHALDTHEIFIMQLGPEQRQTVARLAVRIVDAVMHSSEDDIVEMFPQLLQRVESAGVRKTNGQSDSVPQQTRVSTS
jgi:hypothetical protein